jgi:hypothetical protein
MSKILHQKLADWLDPCRRVSEPVDLGELKKTLAARGVNGRGWRLYLDFGDALFSPLGKPWVHDDQPFASGPNAVAWLRLLQACEMDMLPPPKLVASMADWPIPEQRIEALPPHFFRAAWKGALAAEYQERSLETFISEEVLPVCRWLYETGRNEPAETAVLKAGWPALVARTREWEESTRRLHEMFCHRPSEPAAESDPDAEEWDPYVRRVEWGRCRFVALTNARQLAEEGEVMVHCVGDYDEICRNNAKRIYSVRERKSGLRIATMSLEYVCTDAGWVWTHDQLKGVRNTEVSNDVHQAADAVLRIFDELPASNFAPLGIKSVCTLPFDDDCAF